MILRYYIKCTTCEAPHTLRISVGHNTYQDHTFPCVNCEEEMKIRMEVDFENIKTELKYIENCEIGNEDGAVINLSPEFPIPPGQLHQDGVFPWMHFVRDHFPLEDKPATHKIKDKKYTDIHMALGGIFAVSEAWLQIKKAWSLILNDKIDLANKFVENYKIITNYQGDISLDSILFHFSSVLIHPGKTHLFENAANEIEKINKLNPQRFVEFKSYYKKNLYLDHRENYLELFSNYFKNISEFDQVLLYSKNAKQVDETFHVSSTNFKRTKMFYGDAFEVLTASFTVLACLSNLSKGRKYDQFETMDLSQYVTINKANRANPFNDIACFKIFSDCIDSQIRNASHHQSMKMIKNGIILYRSPGATNWKKIPYIKYLYMCNEIMLSICALHMIELLVAL